MQKNRSCGKCLTLFVNGSVRTLDNRCQESSSTGPSVQFHQHACWAGGEKTSSWGRDRRMNFRETKRKNIKGYMSECHSVWLSEIIHISLKNHITILNLPRRGGRRITAKEAEQRKPLFRFKSLNSWKKQRTLNYPPFPPTVKPEALTRLLVGRKAPPWHDLLDLAECSPVEQRGGAERETRTPDLRQACVKSKPLQRGDPR